MGDEKIVFLWFFVMIIIVVSGIVLGVNIFYSAKIDIRALEAKALNDRIFDCISDNLDLVEEITSGFDFYSACELSKEAIDKNFYFNVSIRDSESGVLIREYNEGNGNFVSECREIEKGIRADYFARCDSQEYLLFYKAEGVRKKAIVSINSGSDNLGGRL